MTKPSKLSDVAAFYAYLRSKKCNLFGNSLSQNQVAGIGGLLTAFAEEGDASPHSLAYILSTTYGEVGRQMVPVREGFKKTDAEAIAHVARLHRRGKIRRNYALPDPVTGHSYYGRGQSQITWPENYKKMGKKLGVDLYNNPDLALDPVISGKVLIRGSLDGDFTGKRLSDYLPDDPKGARRVINGTNKAKEFANYYFQFLAAIEHAGGLIEVVTLNPKTINQADKENPVKSESEQGTQRGVVSAIIEVLAMLVACAFGGKK